MFQSSSAGATQVGVRSVVQALVAGVGVDGDHETGFDAEVLVENLDQRSQAVRGARSVRDDVVNLGVVGLAVHADDEGGVFVLRGSGDDDLLGAAVDVGLSLGCVGEEAGGLDHDVNAELAPGEVGGIALSESSDAVAVDGDGLVVVGNFGIETTQDGVVLEQVCEGLVVGEVVDGNDLDIGALLREQRGRSYGRCGQSR